MNEKGLPLSSSTNPPCPIFRFVFIPLDKVLEKNRLQSAYVFIHSDSLSIGEPKQPNTPLWGWGNKVMSLCPQAKTIRMHGRLWVLTVLQNFPEILVGM